jgi:hypothetical protein
MIYLESATIKVDYYKNERRGETGMCEIMEELFEIYKMEIAVNLLKNGVDIELILKSVPNITREKLENLAAELGVSATAS